MSKKKQNIADTVVGEIRQDYATSECLDMINYLIEKCGMGKFDLNSSSESEKNIVKDKLNLDEKIKENYYRVMNINDSSEQHLTQQMGQVLPLAVGSWATTTDPIIGALMGLCAGTYGFELVEHFLAKKESKNINKLANELLRKMFIRYKLSFLSTGDYDNNMEPDELAERAKTYANQVYNNQDELSNEIEM